MSESKSPKPYTGLRKHMMFISTIQPENVTALKNELVDYADRHHANILEFDYRVYSKRLDLTLEASAMTIRHFVNNFAKKHHIQEMGVSEFARVMYVSDEEAAEWYTLFQEDRHLDHRRDTLTEKIRRKYQGVDDIQMLEYLALHMTSHSKRLIESRIDHLKGNPDPWVVALENEEHIEKLQAKYLDGEQPQPIDTADLHWMLNYLDQTRMYPRNK